ncbi:MAG: Rho termination factor N-terminal domain-containing protein [Desulfobacterales bacterium]|jgi:hypothetical protein|nr:Rho termination factor N-terminal domain-containing protein [Desulfobacterales bacterium]
MGDKEKTKEKPLEKMTAKDLREMAMGLPGITGAHGMNKPELISAIKQAKGITEEKSSIKDVVVRDVKVKIGVLKGKRVEALAAKNAKMATRFRRQISKLKKKTRRAA